MLDFVLHDRIGIPRKRIGSPTCRLVLPFHTVWHRSGFRRTALQVLARIESHIPADLLEMFDLGISWSLAAQHLPKFVQSSLDSQGWPIWMEAGARTGANSV